MDDGEDDLDHTVKMVSWMTVKMLSWTTRFTCGTSFCFDLDLDLVDRSVLMVKKKERGRFVVQMVKKEERELCHFGNIVARDTNPAIFPVSKLKNMKPIAKMSESEAPEWSRNRNSGSAA
ncbi:hypothetical protein L1987_12126 [Smallanthus sonchifolius]|uniref:Uncharacterized protein n=1 Tax=Smallanthus sonchifolius TaxID=185202 RepID=A0ACB9JGC3_9ASTR|nr:hypothetical protein L1987_12126 [Smallanthus sonchifolius]